MRHALALGRLRYVRAIYAMLADPGSPMVAPTPPDAHGLLESAFEWWGRRPSSRRPLGIRR